MEYLSVSSFACSKGHNEADAGYKQGLLPFWHLGFPCYPMLQHVVVAAVSQHCLTYRQGSPDSSYAALTDMPALQRKHLEKKRKDYAFGRQFNEKLSITPGWPGPYNT